MKETQSAMKKKAEEHLKDQIKRSTKNLKTDCDCSRQKINLLLQLDKYGASERRDKEYLSKLYKEILIGVQDYCKKEGLDTWNIDYMEDCD